MRFASRHGFISMGALAGLLGACGVIGPNSPWDECGAELQECCVNGACGDGLDCTNGMCTTSPSWLRPDAGACGNEGQECCQTKAQCAGTLTCESGACRAPLACGQVNQSCCTTGSPCAASLTCQSETCRPAPVADLVVLDFAFAAYPPTSGIGTLSLCLNRDSLGNASANGNFIKVGNGGTADAPAFEVEVGVISVATKESFACPFRLLARDGMKAGYGGRWEGPLCCKIDCSLVPTGSYQVFVLADPTNAVTEASVANNLLVKPEQLSIP